MKKKIIFFLVFLVAFSSCENNYPAFHEENGWEEGNLSGKVKTIVQLDYLSYKPFSIIEYCYDSLGNTLSENLIFLDYMCSGNYDKHYRDEYIFFCPIIYNGDTITSIECFPEYVEIRKGGERITSLIREIRNRLSNTIIDGKISRQYRLLKGWTEYEYKNGELIRTISENNEEVFFENNRKVKHIGGSKTEDSDSFETIYEYEGTPNKGKITEITVLGDKTERVFESTYLDGLLVSKACTIRGLKSWSEENVYDENGNLINRIYKDFERSSTEEYRYEYLFDSFGNWIRKTEYKDNIKNDTTERFIEYY